MRPSLVVLACLAVALVSCGGEEARQARPADAESSAGSGASSPAGQKPSASLKKRSRLEPLTSTEQKQLRGIATSIENAIEEFDKTVRACTHEPSCVDAAFALVVADLDWPPYYLQRIGARQRDCEPLTSAATGIYGFNLGVRQLDYAAPVEDGTRQRDEGALVDGLRPVPSELRSAAASGCL